MSQDCQQCQHVTGLSACHRTVSNVSMSQSLPAMLACHRTVSMSQGLSAMSSCHRDCQQCQHVTSTVSNISMSQGLPAMSSCHKDCHLPDNEAADSLAKEGTTKEQVDRSTSYPEVKTILKAKQHSKWRHKHPRYNKADHYYLLTRREQVTVFRLRTGHNRLNYHLYSKLHIGHTEHALAVLAVRQQNIYCSSAPPTSHSERESGQTTLP